MRRPLTLAQAWHLLAAIYRGRWLAAQDEARYWRSRAEEAGK